MTRARTLMTGVESTASTLLALVVVLAPTIGAAELTDEQRCIDRYNKRLRLVSEEQGDAVYRCIYLAGRAHLTDAEAQSCLSADPTGDVARKKNRVVKLYPPFRSALCTGAEPVQQGAAIGNAAHVQGPTDLAHDLFGAPLAGVSGLGTDDRRCQARAIRRATRLFSTKVEQFWRCKQRGLRDDSVTDSTTLAAQCVTPSIPDPRNSIAQAVTRLVDNVTSDCAGLALGTLFQGMAPACHTSAAVLASCIETATECRVCETLNTADGMSRDCDLFDDGLANGSCGMTLHKCVLAPDPASTMQIHLAALPVALTFPLSGSLDIGTAGPLATCGIQSLAPVNIPAIGWLCIQPATGCPDGARWCGPGAGPALGVDVQSDGNAGSCTSAAACNATCAAQCAPNAVLSAGCTGFCSAGTEAACTTDAECAPANGACNGPDLLTLAQANICQCTCLNSAAHGPSDPGDLQCNLATTMTVEGAAPCDGTDVLIALGKQCLPFSTQRATGLITDANFVPASQVPPPPYVNDLSGNPVACATLDASTTTGSVAVGATTFFGSVLGDISIGLQVTCM